MDNSKKCQVRFGREGVSPSASAPEAERRGGSARAGPARRTVTPLRS